MVAPDSHALSRTFRGCLHLGDDLHVIERALAELRHVALGDLVHFFDTRELQLAPLLFWHLKERRLTHLLAAPLAAELERRYQRNVARNLFLEQRLQAFLARLAEHDVEVLVLKGASAFTTELATFRHAFVLSDIDLLVRPLDLTRASTVLESLGYSPTQSQVTDGKIKQGFLGADGFARIDLHTAFFWSAGSDYVDYVPSDLWRGSKRGSLGPHPIAVLSDEDQICHRLVHDSVGHGDSILTSSTCRLYYLCALVDFYAERIDWRALMGSLEPRGTDRLLAAYIHYGQRELGLKVPPGLPSPARDVPADVVLIDAAAESAVRLADYSHRIVLAVLTARTVGAQLRNVCRSLGRRLSADALSDPNPPSSAAFAWRSVTRVVKAVGLQLAAALYIAVYRAGVSRRETKSHVGSVA